MNFKRDNTIPFRFDAYLLIYDVSEPRSEEYAQQLVDQMFLTIRKILNNNQFLLATQPLVHQTAVKQEQAVDHRGDMFQCRQF